MGAAFATGSKPDAKPISRETIRAVTALVAQNTTGVKSIQESTPDFLAEQLDCVFTDIFPDAVKTGMVATSGDRLISEDALETAVRRSKDYIFGALSVRLNLGHGSGPMDHMWDLQGRFTGEASSVPAFSR